MRFVVFVLVAVGVRLVEVLALTSSSSSPSTRREPIGRINTLDRTKVDGTADSEMYDTPRFVTHTDDNFIKQLNHLYEEVLPSNDDSAVVLDLMSSHVSHLPADRKWTSSDRVDVHGMNRAELEANPARKSTCGKVLLRDLNANPSLVGLCKTGQYDAVLCCVGVQYLEEPEAVFAEIGRVLKPGGVAVISFSNRFFYQKALVGWIERGMKGRFQLVVDYFRAAGGFETDSIRLVGDGTSTLTQLLSVGGIGGDPFVAVVATSIPIGKNN